MGDDEEGTKYQLFVAGSDQERLEGSKMFTGQAKAFYPTGDTYDGTFVEGYRRGKGTYFHKKNGDSYEGHYEENKRHGFGKMTYTSIYPETEEGEEPDPSLPPRGGVYLGYFTHGVRGCRKHPPGQDKDPDAEEMTEGTFTYANGDIYVGEWQEGKKHGRGSYSFAKDGTKLTGEWVNGKIVSGQWTFPNGTFYSGKFRYNKPFGKGVWVFKNGNQVTGDYIQKEQVGDDEPAGGDEEEEGKEKPDPKVWCHFKPAKDVAVKGGSMFGPKCGSLPLVQPSLDH